MQDDYQWRIQTQGIGEPNTWAQWIVFETGQKEALSKTLSKNNMCILVPSICSGTKVVQGTKGLEFLNLPLDPDNDMILTTQVTQMAQILGQLGRN